MIESHMGEVESHYKHKKINDLCQIVGMGCVVRSSENVETDNHCRKAR